MLFKVTPVFKLLGDESGWCAVENFKNTCTPFYCKPSTEDVKEHQMWRLDENSNIVSEFNNGILGVNEENALATYLGKAMKSRLLLGPFCVSEFWRFFLLKI